MNDREIDEVLRLLDAGDWDGAHELVQGREDRAACHFHALLHRMEGDTANAGYWYRRANQPFPDSDPQTELQQLREHYGR